MDQPNGSCANAVPRLACAGRADVGERMEAVIVDSAEPARKAWRLLGLRLVLRRRERFSCTKIHSLSLALQTLDR